MFGSLLGTLAKFRQEETSQKEKVLKMFQSILQTKHLIQIEPIRKKNEPKSNSG